MNNTHVSEEQHREEAGSRWWDGSYRDWLSVQDPQETLTTTTFSAPHTPTTTRSVVPVGTTDNEAASHSSVKLYLYVCARKKNLKLKCEEETWQNLLSVNKGVKTLLFFSPCNRFSRLAVAHKVRPWDILK